MEIQDAKTEINMIRDNMEKERALHEMEKNYVQQEMQKYTEKCHILESEMRRIKSENSRLCSELEEY